jgi:glutamyl-tRNA synthetase
VQRDVERGFGQLGHRQRDVLHRRTELDVEHRQPLEHQLARDAQGAGYMLAVVVDDAAMGVTEVVRGDDLLSATPRQLLLYRALGLRPPAFTHVPLVVSEEGRRLAKRHGDTRISAFREAGLPPEKIIGLLAWWCGWAEWGARLTLREVLPRFDLRALPHAPAVLTQRVKDELGI